MNRLFGFALSLAFALQGEPAAAQIQNQPVEVVEATPLSTFSERSGAWPSQQIPDDRLTNDRSDLSERLNSIPGLQARTNGSPVVSIRGSAQADRTLRLFDGLPLNMADGVGASEFLIPYEAIGSLSLIKGPASVFYGGSSMAGALDHRLRFFERNAVRIGAAEGGGGFGPRHLFGALVLPPSTHVERGQLTLFHETNPGNYPYSSTSMTKSGRRENNASDLSRATLAADAKSGSWNFHLRGLGAKAIGETPGSLYSPAASTFDTTTELVSLEAKRTFDEGDAFSVRLTDSRLWGLYDRNTVSSSTTFSSRSSLSLDSRATIAGSGLRSFGDLVAQEISGTYLGDSKFHQYDADLGQSWEIPLDASVILQPAYRYRSASRDWFKAIGFLNDDGNSRRFLTYSEGFRSASLSDRYGVYGTFRGNPSLAPEKSWSIESGFSEEHGRRYGTFLDGFAYGGSIYFTQYEDLVDTKITGPTTTKINVGRARSTGFELNGAANLGVWMLSAAYNYLDARNTTANEPLRLSPLHQLSVSAAQQLGPVVVELRDTYWSEFHDRHPVSNALTALPAWNTVDLEMRTIGLTDLEMKFGVTNLFDKPRELTMGYPEPQRRVFASALKYF